MLVDIPTSNTYLMLILTYSYQLGFFSNDYILTPTRFLNKTNAADIATWNHNTDTVTSVVLRDSPPVDPFTKHSYNINVMGYNEFGMLFIIPNM